jgi:hypothetical protein
MLTRWSTSGACQGGADFSMADLRLQPRGSARREARAHFTAAWVPVSKSSASIASMRGLKAGAEAGVEEEDQAQWGQMNMTREPPPPPPPPPPLLLLLLLLTCCVCSFAVHNGQPKLLTLQHPYLTNCYNMTLGQRWAPLTAAPAAAARAAACGGQPEYRARSPRMRRRTRRRRAGKRGRPVLEM